MKRTAQEITLALADDLRHMGKYFDIQGSWKFAEMCREQAEKIENSQAAKGIYLDRQVADLQFAITLAEIRGQMDYAEKLREQIRDRMEKAAA